MGVKDSVGLEIRGDWAVENVYWARFRLITVGVEMGDQLIGK